MLGSNKKIKTIAIVLAVLLAGLGFVGYKYIPWKLHYNQVYKRFVLEGYEDAGMGGKKIIVDDKYDFQVGLPYIFEHRYLSYAYNLIAGFIDVTPDGLYSRHHISISMPTKNDKNYHYFFYYQYCIYDENGDVLEDRSEFVAEIDRNRNFIRSYRDKDEALQLLKEYDSEIQELFNAAEVHWEITFP
jgi:hypothetical protein